MKLASIWALHYKIILRPVHRMRQMEHIYIYIYTPRQNSAKSRLEGNLLLMVNFIAFLVSTDAPGVFLTTFVYTMYRHNRSKSVGVNSCNKSNFILEFSSSLTWHWRWGSSFQREDNLHLCQCGTHHAPTSTAARRSSPLLPWLFRSIWTGRLRCLEEICVSKQCRVVCHRHTYLYLSCPTTK